MRSLDPVASVSADGAYDFTHVMRHQPAELDTPGWRGFVNLM